MMPPSDSHDIARSTLFDRPFRLLLTCAAIGAILYASLQHIAFPNAGLKLKVGRLDAQSMAIKLAAEQGYAPQAPVVSTIFQVDKPVRNFIEQQYKLNEARALINSEVPVFSWSTAIRKQEQVEEIVTNISTAGELVEMRYHLPGDFKGPDLPPGIAKQVARAYFDSHAKDAKRFGNLVEDDVLDGKDWTTHFYSWEDESRDFHGARLRATITIAGNKVVWYKKALYIPSSWYRLQASKNSPKTLLSSLSGIFSQILSSLALAIACWAILTRNIRWRPTLYVGLLIGAASVLQDLNRLPLLLNSINPYCSLDSFILQQLSSSIRQFFYSALEAATYAAAGEYVYRCLFKNHVALENLLTRQGLATSTVFRAILVGALATCIAMGWTVVFYSVGRYFGVWRPMILNDASLLSTYSPAFSAFQSGLGAALSEELTDRVLGLGLGLYLFKNFWIANIFQAVLWGLCHCGYPQDPAWARLVEVGVDGIFQGWLLRRYGILTCFCGHYLYNAYIGTESLLLSGNAVHIVSGLVVFLPYLVMLLLAIHFSRRKGTDVADTALRNSQIALLESWREEQSGKIEVVQIPDLSGVKKAAMIFLCILAVLCQLSIPKHLLVGSTARLTVRREEAIKRADDILYKNHIKPAGWMTSTDCWTSYVDSFFNLVLEQKGREFAHKYYEALGYGFRWGIRFFKPGTGEEYFVSMNGAGECPSLTSTKPFDAPGAKITEENAKVIAQAYIKDLFPNSGSPVLRSIVSSEKPTCRACTVTYSLPNFQVNEAEFRVQVFVQGDKVEHIRTTLEMPQKALKDGGTKASGKLPPTSSGGPTEKVSTQDSKNETSVRSPGSFFGKNFLAQLTGQIGFAKYALFAIWAVMILRRGVFNLRLASVLALFFGACLLVNLVNESTDLLDSYNTAIPLRTFVVQSALSKVTSVLDCVVRTWVFIALCLAALKELLPSLSIRGYIQWLLNVGDHSGQQARLRFAVVSNALFIAVGSIAAVKIHQCLLQWLYLQAPGYLLIPWSSASSLSSLANSHSPFIGILSHVCTLAMDYAGYLIVLCHMVGKQFRSRRLAIGVGLLVIILDSICVENWTTSLLNIAYHLTYYAVCYFFVVRVARDNILAYVLFFLLNPLVGYIIVLLNYGAAAFYPELILSICTSLLPLAWVAFLGLRSRVDIA